MMEYRGYRAPVMFDDDAGVFHGEVIGTRDVITFQGESVADLRQAFAGSVDDYLAFCRNGVARPTSLLGERPPADIP